MTSIRVPDTISKLNPQDKYPVVEGADVGGFPELETEVHDNTAKIQTNITNISNVSRTGTTNLVKIVDDTAPDLGTAPHGNYILVVQAASTVTKIDTPRPTGGMINGALLTIYNEKVSDSVAVSAENVPDSFINAGNLFNIPAESFVTFVYTLATRTFNVLESGYIPTSRVNLIHYIKQTLSDSLHTPQEISDQGFIKGIYVSSDEASQAPILTDHIRVVGGTLTHDSLDGVTIHLPTDSGGSGVTQADFVGLTAEVDTNKKAADNAFITINQNIDAIQSDAHDTQVEIDGLGDEVANLQDAMNTGLVFQDIKGTSLPTTHVTVMPPLTIEAGDAEGDIALSTAHTAASNAGFYATLSRDIPVYNRIGKNKHIPIYFDNIVVGSSLGIYTAPLESAYNIADTADTDWSQTAGTDYLVEAIINVEGEAPTDGFIRAYLIETNPNGDGSYEDYLVDANGDPMIMEFHYKAGQSFGKITMSGMINVTEEKRFQVQLAHNFDSHEMVIKGNLINEEGSSFLIQEVSARGQVSVAMQQFEADNNVHIKFSQVELGTGMIQTGSSFLNDVAATTVEKDVITAIDSSMFIVGYHEYQYSISNNTLSVGGVSGANTGYYICFKLDKELSYLLRGKDVTFTMGIGHPNSKFEILAANYTGSSNPSNDFIETHVPDTGVTLKGDWVMVGTPETIETDSYPIHDHVLKLTIPDDAQDMMFAISTPLGVQAKDLEMNRASLDVDTPFKYSAVKSHSYYHNNYIGLNTETVHLKTGTGGFALSGVEEPLSLGFMSNHLDSLAVRQDGPNDQERLVALMDGEISIDTKVRLSNSSDTASTVQVAWYFTEDGNDDGDIVPSTQTAIALPAHTDGYNHVYQMGPLSMALEEGQGFKLKAVVSNGGTSGITLVGEGPDKPRVESTVVYKSVPSSLNDEPVPETQMFSFDVPVNQLVELPLDKSDAHDITGITVIDTTNGKYKSTDTNGFSYKKGKLTVHVGTASTGKVAVSLMENK